MPGRGRSTKAAIKPAVLWFTGLSGSGKSTIAEKVVDLLQKRGMDVEYLDGDRVRAVFPQTGFTREERQLHIRRIGFLAAMLEKHGVFVVASFISPYRDSRDFIRKLCRRFIEVHVSTPLRECERRDVKGLYAKARRGEIRNFTGLDDPFELPKNPEMKIDTTGISVETAVNRVMKSLAGAITGRRGGRVGA